MNNAYNIEGATGTIGRIHENDRAKYFNSPTYNYIFDKKTGYFARWGKTIKDDPEWSEFGPEIADIEISTICHEGCKFCYKSNTTTGKNMSLNTFKTIFLNLFSYNPMQIAFGIGSIDSNPDIWHIFKHCRENNIVPNVTINGSRMIPQYYDNLVNYCGAVAISLYDYERCYTAIEELGKRGLKQVNIHAMLSEETYDRCMQVMNDYQSDERLKKYLNAIVFLWLKPKGRGETLHSVSREKYNTLVKYAIDHNIPIGFDSCSASNFLKCGDTEKFKNFVEPCESTLFSIYINVDGIATPCSFAEDKCDGVDVISANNFITDVWMSKSFVDFRSKVTANIDDNGCRMCPLYELGC
jgi:hypothetical protein